MYKRQTYTLQQSLNGVDFADVCAVNASNLSNYACTVPADKYVKNYYRIQVKDVDGKKDFSNIVLLQTASFSPVSTYPNPVKDQLYFNSRDVITAVTISSITGRKMFSTGVQNNVVNVADLPKGIYIVSFTTKGTTQTIKFLKD